MMICRIVAAILFCTGTLLADPATNPTSVPATQPGASKFPSPTEMAMRLKRLREQKAALSKVAYFSLDGPIAERPRAFSLFSADVGDSLREIVARLDQARQDKSIRAVLVTLGPELSVNLAQAQELRDALLNLRRGGKKTFVYADSYDTAGYTIASGATNVCLLEGGEIMIPGVGLETMFYKGTLDKIGVEADYVQIGEFKGAEEPYTRTAPSEELRGEFSRLTDALFDQIVQGISLGRNLSSATVRELIDDTMVTGQVAKERGFVDHLVDQDGLRDLIRKEIGNDIDLVRDYGEVEKPALDFSNPLTVLAAMSRKPEVSDKPAVAVVFAEGVITDGAGDGGLFSDAGVGSDSMRRALRTAARDDKVKAVVLRIDSPGGSALASEAIWQAIRRVSQDADKPVIVSIGSMAASGGYYLASAGDYIFADRCAIVGSIGVVGGKFVLKELYDKIGLNTESFTKGRNAGLFSSSQRWDDRQRRLVRTWMQQTYDQFTARVMTTRGDRIKDIDKVARGRVFLAQQARELGMVDELGGCDQAVAYAAKQAGLEQGNYDIRVLPAPRTLADLFGRSDDEDAMAPIRPASTLAASSLLEMLPRSARALVRQQIQVVQMLERRPVLLVSPYIVTIR